MTEDGRYKLISSRHWVMIHWRANPGLAISEVLLGQRIPRDIYIDTLAEGSLSRRQFVSCDDCGTLTSYALWQQSGSDFGNHFGLVCPNCAAPVPCQRNWTARALDTLAWPVMRVFGNRWRRRAHARQLEKLRANMTLDAEGRITAPAREGDEKPESALFAGLFFGGFMFVTMTIFNGLVDGFSQEMILRTFMFHGLMGGLFFGLAMKLLSKTRWENTLF